MMTLDFAVLGDSLAASAALNVLVSGRLTGAWLDDARDSGGIDNLASVAGPGGRSRISGADLRQRLLDSVRDRLKGEGVATKVDLERDGVRISTLRGEVINAAYVVAAPFGTEVDPPARLALEAYYGLGVSNDATADACFFENMPVVVWGNGYRAAEQALIAAHVTAAVVVVSDDAVEFGDLAEEVNSHPKIALKACSAIAEILGDDEGKLAGLVLETDRGTERLEARAMFLARGLEFSAGIYGGWQKFQRFVQSGRVIPAGIAHGVPHHERTKSIRSGLEAAEALLARLGLDGSVEAT